MKVDIKLVDKCRNGAYGNFLARSSKYALITISRHKNRLLADYWLTLLHELLHLFFTLVRRQGFRITDKNEHKVIEMIEDTLTNECRKYCKKKTLDKNQKT